jgi:hypothetical protein
LAKNAHRGCVLMLIEQVPSLAVQPISIGILNRECREQGCNENNHAAMLSRGVLMQELKSRERGFGRLERLQRKDA